MSGYAFPPEEQTHIADRNLRTMRDTRNSGLKEEHEYEYVQNHEYLTPDELNPKVRQRTLQSINKTSFEVEEKVPLTQRDREQDKTGRRMKVMLVFVVLLFICSIISLVLSIHLLLKSAQTGIHAQFSHFEK